MLNKLFNWLLDARTAWRNVAVVTEVRRVATLTKPQYDDFEKKVHAVTIVNSTTTELQAGYQLGVQHALKVLREGWVQE